MAETWRLVKQKAQLAQDHGTIVMIGPDCVRVGNAGWSGGAPRIVQDQRAAMARGLGAGFIASGLARAARCHGIAACGSRLAAIADLSQRRSFFMRESPSDLLSIFSTLDEGWQDFGALVWRQWCHNRAFLPRLWQAYSRITEIRRP